MQAVADRLGVDRTTINYHFADREELFATVASAMLSSELADYTPPESDDWRDWVRSYAQNIHGALIRHSSIVLYVKLPLGSDAAALAPGEAIISKLLDAGFDEDSVGHAVAFISEVVHATAQNEILVSQGGHPQGEELIRFLEDQPADAVPGLRRLIELNPLGRTAHFDFAIQMVIAGLESLLPSDRYAGSKTRP
ncbi:hypothetical protein GCM10027406_31500 [Leifsonia lichenia]